MEIARIRVSGVKVHVLYKKIITAGMIGAEIALEFDGPAWDNLQKTVVFNGNTIKDVINPGMVVSIPPEVIADPARALYVGVYGTDSENNEAIPTLWANLGEIHTAADPSGDETTNPSLPVYAQLLELKTGPQGPRGIPGPAGPAGPAGKFEDLTEEQKESLRGPAGPAGPAGIPGPAGPAGPAGKFEDLTEEQKESLRGPAGPAGADGKFEDLTEEQKESLRGPAGPQGPQGATGTVDKSNITVTLAVTRWSSLAQTVNASGVTSDNTVIVAPTSGSHNAYNEAGVYCSAQASGKLTFRCSEKPSVALTVNVLIIN